MKFFDTLKATVAAPEERAITSESWEDFLTGRLVGSPHTAGVDVSVSSATQLSAVYASWRIISEAIATMPRDAQRRGANGIPKAFRPRPAWLDYPSLDDTWTDFMSQIMVSLLAYGNAFIAVQWKRVPKGWMVEQLTVLDPTRATHGELPATVEVVGADGQKRILPEVAWRGPDAQPRAGLEVLHIRGMTMPGSYMGLSPIEVCAEVVGVSLAAQRYGAGFFQNDGTPGGIVELPAEMKLSPTGQAALRQAWRDLYSGEGKNKNVAVLTEGAKFQKLQVNPNEAQFLETRKFGVQEIARIYGIPPHLLSDTTNSTGWGTGMQEQNTAFVIHTLRPWLERVESRLTLLVQQEVNSFTPEASPASRVFVSINSDSLLRGATQDRWAMLRANVATGVMTADEARKAEGLDPYPDELGAVPWIPLAQAPQEEEPEEEDDQEPEPVAEEEGANDE